MTADENNDRHISQEDNQATVGDSDMDDQCYDMSDSDACYTDPCCEVFCCCC